MRRSTRFVFQDYSATQQTSALADHHTAFIFKNVLCVRLLTAPTTFEVFVDSAISVRRLRYVDSSLVGPRRISRTAIHSLPYLDSLRYVWSLKPELRLEFKLVPWFGLRDVPDWRVAPWDSKHGHQGRFLRKAVPHPDICFASSMTRTKCHSLFAFNMIER